MTEISTVGIERHCTLPARDARGRFIARAGAMPPLGSTRAAVVRRASPARTVPRARAVKRTPRARTLPARDRRGRFVAFPTTEAPSWYVLCVGGDRIVAPPPAPIEVGAGSQVAPRSIARARLPLFTSGGLHSAFLVLLVIVVSAWYRLQLAVPSR